MMNLVHSSTEQDVQARAEDWFARLRAPDCPATEHSACELWRNASPENEAAYQEVQRLWERSALLRLSPEIAHATAMAMRPSGLMRVQRRWHLPAAAAVTLLALGLGLFTPWMQRGNAYTTGTGEQRSITLVDGSKVLLDAESQLTVRYSEHQRKLLLTKGQAQFKVEHDKQRPFVVQAANGAVTALGTEFQVRVIGQEVLVTLLEGKVAVDMPGPSNAKATETLIAGQQIAYSKQKKEVWKKRAADLEVAKGWTYGDLVFKRWRLDDLVAEMNRYSPTKLVIEDPSLGDLVVSGRFHAGDHQSLILALENDWPVRADPVSSMQVALYRR